MTSQVDFATLTPADARTSRALADVLAGADRLSQHHQHFIRRDAAPSTRDILTRREDNARAVSSSFGSSGVTTEADLSSDDDDPPADQGCYVLSFVAGHPPVRPAAGWQAGFGDFNSGDITGGVDFVLAPPSARVSRSV